MQSEHCTYKQRNKYEFYKMLLLHYQKRFDFNKLENIHDILNGQLNNEEKKFFETPVKTFGYDDRDSVLIKSFHNFFDNNYTIVGEYIKFVENEIKPLFPNEEYIVVQKTPNIRFHMPEFSNIGRRSTDKYKDIIGLHKDAEFNHPSSEYNVVVPITKMFETNTMYYEEVSNSCCSPYEYNNMTLDTDEFFIGNLNGCNHYNKINKTTVTRVSFDFRFQLFSEYQEVHIHSATNKKRFMVGDYYMLI